MPTLLDCRADFPVLHRKVDTGELVYLDNAATTLKPSAVIEAITGYYTRVSANIHRGKHILSEEASERVELVRAQVAEHLGVAPKNVVFTRNTTDGMNLVAAGLPLRPDDLVAIPADSHHSAQLPWRRRARTHWIEATADGTLDEAGFAAALERRPRVVVFTACSNVTGHYVDLDRLVPAAHAAGAFTVVDAAQYLPHRRLRVGPAMDAVAFSAHKMLGPTGVGVLYLSDRLIEAIGTPQALGGGTVDWVDESEFHLRRPPYRFEAGTPDIAGIYGLGAALDYLDGLGAPALAEHEQTLVTALLAEAATRPHLRPVGGTSIVDRAPILTVTLDGIGEPSEVARCLSDSYGVMCRSGFFCSQPYFQQGAHTAGIRLAPYVYNTVPELRTAFAALDEVWHFLRRR